MKVKDNTITASKGKVLTNGSVYAKAVALGIKDSPDNWHEITEDEYKALCEAAELENAQ